MADEQRPDEADLSKRERQKARRQKRLEAERAAAASAQRRRIGGFVLVGVVIAGVVGYFVQQNLAERRAEREIIAAAQENLEELGCTPDEEMPHLGAGHFSGPQELPDNPPEALYDHLPTTSGRHIASVVVTGVYDEYVDERLTTHNLEHGYVGIWYDEEADAGQVEELKEFARERIDGGDNEIFVAPYDQPLDDDANFAFVAWDRRQLCQQFDPGIALNFINEHMNNQRSPEAVAGPHLGGNQGELDPAEDVVVFPPMGEEAPEEESFAPEEGGEGHDEEADTGGDGADEEDAEDS